MVNNIGCSVLALSERELYERLTRDIRDDTVLMSPEEQSGLEFLDSPVPLLAPPSQAYLCLFLSQNPVQR